MRYEVTADKAALAARRLSVTTSFDVVDGGVVLLSLPAWTPGAYEITNFARWVSGFRATEDGAPLRWDKLDYDTWRVRPATRRPSDGQLRVRGRHAGQRDVVDPAGLRAVQRHRTSSCIPKAARRSLRRRSSSAPTGVSWIATGLDASAAARTYKASNYHDLVDMPVFVGRFDLDSASIAGKTVRYATYPTGSVAKEARATAWEQLKRVIPVEVNVFGEAPWDTYTVMQIADSSYQGFSGLEHASSHVDIVAPQFIGSDFQPSLYAHEIFHSWNVKRLRPADLVPYRYDRPQPTTWLWVSEGITDYYADLAEVRGGVVDAAGFYALTVGEDRRDRDDGSLRARGCVAQHVDPSEGRHGVQLLSEGIARRPAARHHHPRRERQQALARHGDARAVRDDVQEGPRLHARRFLGRRAVAPPAAVHSTISSGCTSTDASRIRGRRT